MSPSPGRSARGTLLAALAVALLAAPGPAAAGTASVAGRTLAYVAAPAEANRVTITRHPDAYRVADAGAPVVAGAGCTSVSANEATCAPDGVRVLRVRVLDLDDVVALASARPSIVRGGDGNDTLEGGEGADTLFGDAGNDTLKGSTGIDFLDGGAGADSLSGGTGVVLPFPFFEEGEEEAELEFDFAVYDRRVNGVTVDFDGAGDDGEPGEGDTVGSDIEVVVGGAGDDVLVGDARANVLVGHRGDDRLRGGGGRDFLEGEAGDDVIAGGDRRDELSGGAGSDALRGGPGRDHLDGGSGRDRMLGEEGGDFLSAQDGRRDRVDGGAGIDCADVDRRLDVLRRVECLPRFEEPPVRVTGARRALARLAR